MSDALNGAQKLEKHEKPPPPSNSELVRAQHGTRKNTDGKVSKVSKRYIAPATAMPPLNLLNVDSQGLRSYNYPSYDSTALSLVGSLRFASDGTIKVSGATETDRVRIENVATPSTDYDAANKLYVDNAVKGLSLKAPVRCSSTTNIGVSSVIEGAVIDGVTLVATDRVLLRHQTDSTENGIYVVQDAAEPPLRALGLSMGASVTGVYCFVDEGEVDGGNRDRSFICTTTGVVGDAQEWVQFAAGPIAYKGDGLAMGENGALDVDPLVVPYLAISNTFTGGVNTFVNQVVAQTTVNAPFATVDTIPSNTNDLESSGIQHVEQGSTANPPVYSKHAVNWQYLYNTMNGLTWKEPVQAIVTVDLGDLANFSVVVDNVTLDVGARVLITNQANGVLNGIYRILDTSPTLARTDDMDTGFDARGCVVVVMKGDENKDKAFLCTSDNAIIGTDPVLFEVMGQSPEQLAGEGLGVNPQTGTSLDVRCDGDTVEYDPGEGKIRIRGGVNNAVLGDKSNVMSQPVEFRDPTPSVSTTTGAVMVTGGVGVTGNVHCMGVYNHSDERLKENMVPLGKSALAAVASMGGYTFTWKANGVPSVGVIAQEVQNVAPLVVEDQAAFLSVDYSKLVPYLIEAVKELHTRLEGALAKPRKIRRTRAPSRAQARVHAHVAYLVRCMV